MHKLHELLRRLAEAGVEFVVIGGYAAVIHGSAYVTNDVAVCAVLSPDNIEKIRKALVGLKPVHRQTHRKLSFLEIPAPGQSLQNLYLETTDGIIGNAKRRLRAKSAFYKIGGMDGTRTRA